LVVGAAGGTVVLPVSCAGCLGLAAAVLEGAAGGTPEAAAVLWGAAADDPGLAAWLVSHDAAADASTLGIALERDLVWLHGDGPATAGPGERTTPDPAAWRALALAMRGSVGPGDRREADARTWGVRLRGSLDAGTVSRLPRAVGGPAAAGPEALVLMAAVRLAVSHHRLAGGWAAEVEAARLEGLRSLAYGAGHEINNPLANIAARGQALLVGETDPQRRRRLATIVDQAFRARDMIGGLMLCARPPLPHPTPCDAVALVAATLRALAGRAAERGVRIDGPESDAAAVWVDRALVEEALRSIVNNALDAVAAGGRVAIAVETPGVTTGRWVVIRVDDDGPGMDAEVRRAAFDPFHSGREAGRGIGFGLAKARRFIIACGGTVELGVSPSGGTRVTVGLPALAGGADARIAPYKPPRPS
jgi:signal transduction histidine kinase